MRGKEAKGKKLKYRKFCLEVRKSILLWEWLSARASGPERLGSLHPWKLNWTSPWETHWSWPCFEQDNWTNDLWSCHPASAVLRKTVSCQTSQNCWECWYTSLLSCWAFQTGQSPGKQNNTLKQHIRKGPLIHGFYLWLTSGYCRVASTVETVKVF